MAWGTFDNWLDDVHKESATTACCTCGGGSTRTIAPTPAPTIITPAPTMAPTYYQRTISLRYAITNDPPTRDDGFGGDSYNVRNLMADDGVSWLAQDQLSQINTSLFLVMDLGSLSYVDALDVRNGWDGSCVHYFVDLFRLSLSDDGEVFDKVVSGQLEKTGDQQIVPVATHGQYLKFEFITYGVAPGLSSLFVMGNEVLTVSSCSSSDHLERQSCAEASDRVYETTGNGWAYGVMRMEPSWAIFNLAGGPTISRVGFISGVGHSSGTIHDTNIEVKSMGAFQPVTNLEMMFGNASAGGNRVNSTWQQHLQLAFQPVLLAEAVKIIMHQYVVRTWLGETRSQPILNEFFVYRSPQDETPAPTLAPTPVCVNSPPGWTSAGGTDCATYYAKEYCTLSGGYGEGWEDSFGSFDLWATKGYSPLFACCACGGGSKPVVRVMPEQKGNTYGLDECPCILGLGNVAGHTELTFPAQSLAPTLATNFVDVRFPGDYGTRCMAWENGVHPNCLNGSIPGIDKDWCTMKWCFVDPCNCNLPVPPRAASTMVNGTYRGRKLFYSYLTCDNEDTLAATTNPCNNLQD
jgi:hypothetical protein